jgi:hypothetical protein
LEIIAVEITGSNTETSYLLVVHVMPTHFRRGGLDD